MRAKYDDGIHPRLRPPAQRISVSAGPHPLSPLRGAGGISLARIKIPSMSCPDANSLSFFFPQNPKPFSFPLLTFPPRHSPTPLPLSIYLPPSAFLTPVAPARYSPLTPISLTSPPLPEARDRPLSLLPLTATRF